MPVYELMEEADSDLQEIVRYTISRWGIEQARNYETLLEDHCVPSASMRKGEISRSGRISA